MAAVHHTVVAVRRTRSPLSPSIAARLLRTAVTLMMASVLAAGCGDAAGTSRGTSGVRTDSLYIGVAASRSPSTVAFFRGVELAVADLNRTRPRGIRPFAVRQPPEEEPSQVAVAASFRDDPGVIGVVGHTGSMQTIDAAPVYGDVEHDGRNAVVAVSPTASNPAVASASEWVFRICPSDEDAARALASFAVDSTGATRVAVLYRNDAFGRGFTRVVVPRLQALGATVPTQDPYLATVTAYDAYAERIARGDVGAVVIAGGAADAAEMVRALRRFGANPAILGTDDVAGIGDDSAAAREFAGVRYASFFLPERAGDGAPREFVRAYTARFAEAPNHRAALAYDAAMMIGRAALATGPDRRAVREHLAAIGRSAPAYMGATGRIAFDSVGGAVGKPVLVGEVRP